MRIAKYLTADGAGPAVGLIEDGLVRPLGSGPTLLSEYAPQGGTNHIHTIIRDPSNDHGKELTQS